MYFDTTGLFWVTPNRIEDLPSHHQEDVRQLLSWVLTESSGFEEAFATLQSMWDDGQASPEQDVVNINNSYDALACDLSWLVDKDKGDVLMLINTARLEAMCHFHHGTKLPYLHQESRAITNYSATESMDSHSGLVLVAVCGGGDIYRIWIPACHASARHMNYVRKAPTLAEAVWRANRLAYRNLPEPAPSC